MREWTHQSAFGEIDIDERRESQRKSLTCDGGRDRHVTVTKHRAANARVFGSVARGEDTDESDLDILIDRIPETSLFDIGGIQYGIRNCLGFTSMS